MVDKRETNRSADAIKCKDVGSIILHFIHRLAYLYFVPIRALFMPRLGGAYCFRRVRSQRKSVDSGTMGPALGGAYECYAHISSFP